LRFGPFFQVFGYQPDTGVQQPYFGGKGLIPGFVEVLVHGFDDEFFIGCNCLPEYTQLTDPEIDVFCFSGFKKPFIFTKNSQYFFAI
jgi:hypothetical protein